MYLKKTNVAATKKVFLAEGDTVDETLNELSDLLNSEIKEIYDEVERKFIRGESASEINSFIKQKLQYELTEKLLKNLGQPLIKVWSEASWVNITKSYKKQAESVANEKLPSAINWFQKAGNYDYGNIYNRLQDKMTQAVNDAIQGRGILSQNLIRQAQMLRGELREKNVKGRYRMVTENAIMKARNFSQVLSYEELKITEYQIVAIVDNKTSNICRALNGQVFETKEAISYVKEVFSTPVYEVADRFPWDNPSRWPKDPETVTPKDIRKLYEGMATKLPPITVIVELQ